MGPFTRVYMYVAPYTVNMYTACVPVIHVLLRDGFNLFCNGWNGVAYIRGQDTHLGEEMRVLGDQNSYMYM